MLDGKSAGVEADPTDPVGALAVDTPPIESPEPSRWLYAYRWREIATVITCLMVWVLRRPEQLTRPYIWDEEAHVVLDFAHNGWISAVRPLGGYEALPASFLVTLSAQLSFAHLTVLTYVFATLIYLTTICIIVLPASRWGGFGLRAALAVCVALVPANPEVFGVLLYSFWWATLWPLAILGWKNPNYKFRIPLLVIASLSSPAGGALCVVFLAAYLRKRQRFDLISAVALLPGFLLDSIQSLTSNRGSSVAHAKIASVLQQTLRTTGEFIARWLLRVPIDYRVVVFLGLLLVLFILYAGVELTLRRRDEVLMLWAATVIYLVLSSLPAPLRIDSLETGRYFFLPYVALSWALVCVCSMATRQEVRTAAIGLLIVSSFNIPIAFSRSKPDTTARLSWTSEVRKCEDADVAIVRIPVYLDGSTHAYWSLDLSPAQCRRLAGH